MAIAESTSVSLLIGVLLLVSAGYACVYRLPARIGEGLSSPALGIVFVWENGWKIVVAGLQSFRAATI